MFCVTIVSMAESTEKSDIVVREVLRNSKVLLQDTSERSARVRAARTNAWLRIIRLVQKTGEILTEKQVKSVWATRKRKVRDVISQEKRYRSATGGGVDEVIEQIILEQRGSWNEADQMIARYFAHNPSFCGHSEGESFKIPYPPLPNTVGTPAGRPSSAPIDSRGNRLVLTPPQHSQQQVPAIQSSSPAGRAPASNKEQHSSSHMDSMMNGMDDENPPAYTGLEQVGDSNEDVHDHSRSVDVITPDGTLLGTFDQFQPEENVYGNYDVEVEELEQIDRPSLETVQARYSSSSHSLNVSSSRKRREELKSRQSKAQRVFFEHQILLMTKLTTILSGSNSCGCANINNYEPSQEAADDAEDRVPLEGDENLAESHVTKLD